MTTAETEEPQLLKNMEDVLTQLTEFQTSLRKKDSALRAKIDAEHKEMEKIARRRDFYKVRIALMAFKFIMNSWWRAFIEISLSPKLFSFHRNSKPTLLQSTMKH